MHPLDNAKLKLERAEQHLETLYPKVQAYLGASEQRMVGEFGEEQVRRAFRRTLESPPVEEWGPIVGDALANMRASLDHLANQLVIAAGHQPTNETTFPIFEEQNDGRLNRRTAGMKAEAVTEVAKLQPYDVPNDIASAIQRHPLWVLQKLSNIDKHKRIHVIPIAVGIGRIIEPSKSQREAGAQPGETVAMLAATPYTEYGVGSPADAIVAIQIPEDGLAFNISYLQDIHDFIRDTVLLRFTRFLP